MPCLEKDISESTLKESMSLELTIEKAEDKLTLAESVISFA